jgi:transposase
VSIVAISLPLVVHAGALTPPLQPPAPPRGRFRQPPWPVGSPDWLRLERDLPQDHLARDIDRAVDALDLTELFRHYAGVGSLAYLPDLLLKILLYEAQRGVHSPARWAVDLHEHLPCQWLAQGCRPGRSRLYAFRDRLGNRLQQWHAQIVTAAQQQGLTDASRASLDGSSVAANSSRHRLLNEDTLVRRLDQLEQAIANQNPVATAEPTATEPAAVEPTAAEFGCVEPATAQPTRTTMVGPAQTPALSAPAEPIPGWMARTQQGRLRQRDRYQEVREQLTQRLEENRERPAAKRKADKDVRLSVGDPEAVLGQDKEKVYRPLYNVQLMPDLDSGLILAYGVFAQATDAGTLEPMLKRFQATTGHYPELLLGDAGYATALDLATCAEAEVTLYAPYQENSFTEQKRAKKPTRQIGKDAFSWSEAEQKYRCPQGHELAWEESENKKRRGGKRVRVDTYRCPPKNCRECPQKQQCCRNPEAGRTIDRSEHEGLVEQLQERMKSRAAKELYKLRSQTVERCFADGKQHRCLRRFSGRGLNRACISVGLFVLAHNALALLKFHDNQQIPAPSSA